MRSDDLLDLERQKYLGIAVRLEQQKKGENLRSRIEGVSWDKLDTNPKDIDPLTHLVAGEFALISLGELERIKDLVDQYERGYKPGFKLGL